MLLHLLCFSYYFLIGTRTLLLLAVQHVIISQLLKFRPKTHRVNTKISAFRKYRAKGICFNCVLIESCPLRTTVFVFVRCSGIFVGSK
jgi:hypothetical protein